MYLEFYLVTVRISLLKFHITVIVNKSHIISSCNMSSSSGSGSNYKTLFMMLQAPMVAVECSQY